MALTINPAVSRGHARWIVDTAAFLFGAFFGALVSLLFVLALAQALLTAFTVDHLALAAAGVVVVGALHDLGIPAPLPYRPRQVPESLREVLPPTAVAFVFGVMLGVGFLTLFTYSTHLAVLCALPFLGSLTSMLGVIAVFAVGKTLVLVAAVGATRLEQVAPRFRWIQWRSRLLRVTTAASSLAIALLLVAIAA